MLFNDWAASKLGENITSILRDLIGDGQIMSQNTQTGQYLENKKQRIFIMIEERH